LPGPEKLKMQKMAKWPNHFMPGKPFQKGQMAIMLFMCKYKK